MTDRKRFLGEFEQMVIAAVLRLGDEAYGVSIIGDVETHTGREVRSGALSVTLDRLEQKRLVRSRLDDASRMRGGRARRYIEVTPEGLAAARESRAAMLSMWRDLEGAYDG